MLLEGIHLFWRIGPELKRGKGTQIWSVGNDNTWCCQAWLRPRSLVCSSCILGKPQISAVRSLLVITVWKLSQCSFDLQILKQLIQWKGEKKIHPGTVAQTREHLLEVGKPTLGTGTMQLLSVLQEKLISLCAQIRWGLNSALLLSWFGWIKKWVGLTRSWDW